MYLTTLTQITKIKCQNCDIKLRSFIIPHLSPSPVNSRIQRLLGQIEHSACVTVLELLEDLHKLTHSFHTTGLQDSLKQLSAAVIGGPQVKDRLLGS